MSRHEDFSASPLGYPIAAGKRAGTPVGVSCILPGYPFDADADFHEDVCIAPQRLPLYPARRLVVLIPENDLDESALARKVWQLASLTYLQVHLLGRSPDEAGASAVRLRLALMAASLQQGRVSASTSIVVGENWSQAVRTVLRDGDLLVCLAGHSISYQVVRSRELGEALTAEFGVPVYLLGGLQLDRSPAQWQALRSLANWGLSLFILVNFAGLQIWLSQHVHSRFSPFLLSLSIIAEGITLLTGIEWLG